MKLILFCIRKTLKNEQKTIQKINEERQRKNLARIIDAWRYEQKIEKFQLKIHIKQLRRCFDGMIAIPQAQKKDIIEYNSNRVMFRTLLAFLRFKRESIVSKHKANVMAQYRNHNL